MKLFVALVVAILATPALASADSQQEPKEGLVVDLLRIVGKGVYVTWSPAPTAITYNVYRGPSLDDLRFVGQTPFLNFADWNAPEADTWYQIVSLAPQNGLNEILGPGPMKGSCLIMRGSTGLALNAANCMPAVGPGGGQ